MDTKSIREKEVSLHKAFYQITDLLTSIYPPSKSFEFVFRHDMFLKVNKNGFHQVAYYLINILEPVKLKHNVYVEPPYDIRLEKQFCNFIAKNLITELNSHHLNANVPQILASQLASACGIKFITFMLRLAQLALYEYLQTKPLIATKILLAPKPSNDPSMCFEQLINLQQITSNIYEKCNNINSEYNKFLVKCRNENEAIKNQQTESTILIKENNSKLKLSNEKLSNYNSEIVENINIDEKLTSLRSISVHTRKYQNAISTYLSSQDEKLKFNENAPLLLDEYVNGEIDLIRLFEKFIKTVDRQRFEIKSLSNSEVIEQSQRIEIFNQRLKNVKEDTLMIIQEYLKYDEDDDGLVLPCSGLQDDTESTPLATPLPKSPTPSPLSN